MEDAEQIGFLGLIRAAKTYRPELGYQFSTYATHWVKNACQRYGPDFALMIHLPQHFFWPCFRLRLTMDRMLAEIGASGVRRYFADLELRDPLLGSQLRDLYRVLGIRSLSDQRQPEYHAARQIADPWSGPLDDLKRIDQAERVQKAVSRLRPRAAQVVRLRYGFDGCPPQTLLEIGKLLGLTRERVRQIQAQAEGKIMRMLRKEMPELEADPALEEGETSDFDAEKKDRPALAHS